MQTPNFLFKERSIWLSLTLAIVLSLLMSAYLFNWQFLYGQGAFFENGDPAQHVSGWLFYLHDQWRFPLAHTRHLGYPQGVNIALTDSIPLAAVLFKIFDPWLPQEFHYFGWWHLFAYLLQGVAAATLIRALGYRSLTATLAAAGFALLTPALTWRYAHTSLTTQALILFAFCAYISGIKKQRSLAISCIVFIFISLTALLIHPYLFGMVYPIYLAFLIDFSFRNKIFKPALQFFGLSVLFILTALFIFGYFSIDKAGGGGFGFYSMNLISPFCGGHYAINCQYGTPGQNEGFNYLGIGFMLILAVVLTTQWRWLLQLPKNYPALAVCMVLFWLMALSNIVYIGQYKLLSFHLPKIIMDLASVYRSSGRFFWPVGYALLFVSLVGLLRLSSKTLIMLIILAGLTLQWLDTRDILHAQKMALQQPAIDTSSAWTSLLASVTAIDIFPDTDNYYPQKGGRYSFFQLLAARNQLDINIAILARAPKNSKKKQSFFDPPLLSNHLYIVMPEMPISSIPETIQTLLRNNQCRQFTMADKSVGLACVLGSSTQWWRETAPQMTNRSLYNL